MTNDQETTIDEANFNLPDELAANEALTQHEVPNEKAKLGVENCCVREFWAVVDSQGNLVRGRNVAYTKQIPGYPPGCYEVFFTGDVSNGVYVATIGKPGYGTEPTGQIGVAQRAAPGLYSPFTALKGVFVETFDSIGQRRPRGFHLIVHTH
jgi:hypothetical protein